LNTAVITEADTCPQAADLWQRFRANEKIADEETASRLSTPANAAIGKGQRYYQEIAITASSRRCSKARSESFSRWLRAARPPSFSGAGNRKTGARRDITIAHHGCR